MNISNIRLEDAANALLFSVDCRFGDYIVLCITYNLVELQRSLITNFNLYATDPATAEKGFNLFSQQTIIGSSSLGRDSSQILTNLAGEFRLASGHGKSSPYKSH